VNFLLRYNKAASRATSKAGSIEQLITASNEQLNMSIIKSRGWWCRRGAVSRLKLLPCLSGKLKASNLDQGANLNALAALLTP